MPLVVGVAFKPVTKVYYFDPAGHENLEPGERVIVETARGRTMGLVVLPPRQVPASEITGTLKPVVRRATAWDMVQSDQMTHKEAETLATCRERATALGLEMKIIRVEYSYDGSSLLVYFTAAQRVDFRNLVHDLTQVLRTRVEMRQVGVRDEAKCMGGFGRCGRELCCASWLREFAPVSIKMAKAQDLPLNSEEVSGVCGRLLCCLSYENDFYVEARSRMPRINAILITPEGPGKVKQVHVLRSSVTVKVEGPNGTTQFVEMPVAEPAAGESAPAAGQTADAPTPQSAQARGAKQPGPADAEKKVAKETEQAGGKDSRPGRRRRPRARSRRRQP
jgi:cell fate regulator YaaT (PSP1 superfamily)